MHDADDLDRTPTPVTATADPAPSGSSLRQVTRGGHSAAGSCYSPAMSWVVTPPTRDQDAAVIAYLASKPVGDVVALAEMIAEVEGCSAHAALLGSMP